MNHDRPILIDVPDRLQGDRIVVRALQDADAEAMHAAIQESVDHLRPWMPWYDQHRSIGDTLDYIRRSRAQFVMRESFPMGIVALEGGDFVGGSGLHPRNWKVPSFEIGYWVRKSCEGQGYVTEAARLLTALAFETLGAQRVMIRCDARNARSKAIPERLGYVEEGRMRHGEVDTSGNLADMLIFSMIPDDYRLARVS